MIASVRMDSQETEEWLDSVDALVAMHGVHDAQQILGRAVERARAAGLQLDPSPTTDYVNTIAPDAEEPFPVGGSKVVRSSDADRATLVGVGVTLFESLKAAESLEGEGIAVRVIDLYSIKPADGETLRRAMTETGLVITVEDHWLEGGVGDAVLDALSAGGGQLSGRVVKIGVTQMPFSGTPEELRDWAGISAERIADRVRQLVS